MAVKTPEIEMPIYGQATQKDAAEATPPMPTGQPTQQLPAGAGFVPKSGAAAYVADGLLKGWLQGRQIRAQKEMQQAQNQIGQVDRIYADQRDRWKSTVAQYGADSPQAKNDYGDAVAAWQHSVEVKGKYAMPEKGKTKDGKKQTGGQKFEGALGQMFGKSGVEPHMFLQSALDYSAKHPDGLYLTPADTANMEKAKLSAIETQTAKAALPGVEAQAQTAQLTLQNTKAQAEVRERFNTLLKIPDNKITPEQAFERDTNERILGLATKDQQQAQQIKDKYLSGQMLTPQEQQFAYASKLIEGPHAEYSDEGLAHIRYLYGADGKLIEKKVVGHQFHESQSSLAQQLLLGQHQARVTIAMDELEGADGPEQKGGKPEDAAEKLRLRKVRAEQMVALEESRNPKMLTELLNGSPGAELQRQTAVSKALELVWNNAGGLNATTEQRGKAQLQMNNFVVGYAKGTGKFMRFKQELQNPTGSSGGFLGMGKKPIYMGDLKAEDMPQKQKELYSQVREALGEQNPTWDSRQIEEAIPSWLADPAGKPPEQGGTDKIAKQAVFPNGVAGSMANGDVITRGQGGTPPPMTPSQPPPQASRYDSEVNDNELNPR